MRGDPVAVHSQADEPIRAEELIKGGDSCAARVLRELRDESMVTIEVSAPEHKSMP